MTKVCTNCKKEKELDEFYNCKSFKDGKTFECKQCMTEYRNKNIVKNRLYSKNYKAENSEECKARDRKYWGDLDPAVRLFRQAGNRARRKNIPFNLELKDIIVPEKCPLLECNFVSGRKYAYPYTQSIDRIDNSKGYIKGNVQVLSFKANSMKNSSTQEELITFAKNIILQNKDNDIVQNLIKQLNIK